MKWMLARRELLRKLGLGAAALPLLRVTGARAQGVPTKKLICVAAIHGYRQQAWKPMAGSLAQQSLPMSCAPLEPTKGDLIFCTDLANRGSSGDAAYSTMFWGLPDVVGMGPFFEPNGATLDGVVGNAVPRSPALNLAVQSDLPPGAGVQPGSHFCFWSASGKPIVPVQDPLKVYQELFAGLPGDDQKAVARLRFQRKSLLDYVSGSLIHFGERVGTEDHRAIESHLQAIRDIEKNLDQATLAHCGATEPAGLDLTDHAQYPAILEAHTSMVVAALGCGISRMATLQLADALGASVNFGAFVPGVPARGTGVKSAYRNWSDLAHNPVLGGIDHKRLVDQWWMARLAALIVKMKGILDAGGSSLFDNTVILWANPVEEGANRNSAKMPWLLAGSAGRALKTGQHLATAGANSSGVLSAICTAMGIGSHPFGAPLPGLLV
jgi:hypothetical protein